jgi:hypothetical protein
MDSDPNTDFLDLISRYPSPHNGQPMMLKKNHNGYDVYFDTSRGLKSTPISYLFSFVTIGVFMQYVESCAEALGYDCLVTTDLPDESQMMTTAQLHCGSFQLRKNDSPNEQLKDAILFRQTSRRNYDEGLTLDEQNDLTRLADRMGLSANFLSREDGIKTAWLNQRAVFDDMFNPAVREELRHWMRFDRREKLRKKDGLAYDCMELGGSSLKFIFKYYKVLRWPVVRNLLKKYYMRTMRDASTVGYVTSPFVTEEDAYKIGRFIINAWLELSKKGKYLHPFGTIVSNDQAHADFLTIAGIANESVQENYVSFIFRAGHSNPPVRSERIEHEQHLLKGEI